MKQYKLLLYIAILSLVLGSCKKYLDVKPITDQTFIETANDCQLILDNYSAMNVTFASDNEVSGDDYFLVSSKYATLLQEDKDFYGWKANAERKDAAAQWQNIYRVVYYANLVLETVNKLKGKEADNTLNALRASALFYRSFALWNIVQLYGKAYQASNAGQAPGIPLRLGSDMNDPSTRGTLQQTYDQIVNDLKEAVNFLPTTSTVASRPNKASAHAMLARTYLSMSKYAEALNHANAALEIQDSLINFNTISQSSSTPFNPRFNAEVLFQAVMVSTTRLSPGTAGNPGPRIVPDLVNLYESNDLRKKIFLKANTMSVRLDLPSNVTLQDSTYRFTGNYDGTSGGALFCGLAVDEIYLIRAEGYARSGQVQKAMDDLNTLLRSRYKTGTYTDQSSGTADEAVTKVLTERRKELLMRGLRWTDLKRLNLPAIRQTRTISFTGTVASPVRIETIDETFTLSAGDLRYALLIPPAVILYTDIAQNQR